MSKRRPTTSRAIVWLLGVVVCGLVALVIVDRIIDGRGWAYEAVYFATYIALYLVWTWLVMWRWRER